MVNGVREYHSRDGRESKSMVDYQPEDLEGRVKFNRLKNVVPQTGGKRNKAMEVRGETFIMEG